MKNIILFLFVFNIVGAQTIKEYLKDDYLTDHWKTMSLTFIAGSFDGLGETLKFHQSDFLEVHPNASQWWGNDSNAKYKNRDPNQGERYFLSTTLLSPLNDGYHASKFIRNGTLMFAITINIGEKKRPILYAVDFINYTLCYSLGFSAIYDLIY